MRKMWTVILLAPLLLVSTVAARPVYSPESLARYFRLDWQVVPSSGGPTLDLGEAGVDVHRGRKLLGPWSH